MTFVDLSNQAAWIGCVLTASALLVGIWVAVDACLTAVSRSVKGGSSWGTS